MVALALLILCAQILTAQDFVGSRSCVVCHSGIARTQATSHHALALHRAPDGRWAFGAGAQAVTFVSQADEDSYLEHGLSWYRKTNALSLTPGHSTPAGVHYPTFAPEASILRCFQCHSTGPLSLGTDRAVQPFEPGVHCENCHGPGSAHAAKPDAETIRNPARLSSAEINSLCGQCHRMPPARDVATNFENPWNVRHQPVYLSQSACFLKSEGRLSCLSCHNTHQDTLPAASAKCVACHAQARHTTTVGTQACVGCHMPKVQPSPLLSFTNHWIGIYRLAGPTANPLRPLKQRAGR